MSAQNSSDSFLQNILWKLKRAWTFKKGLFFRSRFSYNFLIKTFLTVCSYQSSYAFQSESTLHHYLNVKELLARSRREIWNLSDCNWTRTDNHLVHPLVASLTKWLSVRLWTKWSWVRVQLQSLKNFFRNIT